MGYWVKRLHLGATQQVNDILKPFGLARSQWNALRHIHEAGQLSQKQLQDLLCVESATLTGIINSLVRKNWIKKSTDDSDRRIKLVELTAEGIERWQTIPDPISMVDKTMTQNLSEKDIAHVRSLLEQAVRNLEDN